VLVCGAGIAGLACAHLLRRQGAEVVVLERSDTLRTEGYMIDFFGPGFDAAEAMGLLPQLWRRSHRVQEVAYVDARGRTTARLDYRQMARALDGRLLSIMRGDLEAALAGGLDAGVELRLGCTVGELQATPEHVLVTLSDGSRRTVDLVIGADGIHSEIRRQAFGPEAHHLRHLGFHTAAYTFTDVGLHRRLADRFVMTDSIDRAVGLYGIRDGRIAVFTVHRAPGSALPADPRAAVIAACGDLGWVVPDVLDRCPDPPALYYDQVAQIELPRWSTGRIVLVGDAGYAVSLLAGQGASLAMAGALVLTSELQRGTSVSAALQAYQDRLGTVVRAKQAAGRRAAEWFLPSSPARLLLRRLVLRSTRVPAVSRRVGRSLVAGAGRIP
jgi:2-polyprenyl-6-methoxyphenol hydroxylase-like FAD-dependent oxidoreductase